MWSLCVELENIDEKGDVNIAFVVNDLGTANTFFGKTDLERPKLDP